MARESRERTEEEVSSACARRLPPSTDERGRLTAIHPANWDALVDRREKRRARPPPAAIASVHGSDVTPGAEEPARLDERVDTSRPHPEEDVRADAGPCAESAREEIIIARS
jgi:hypothetical protein